MTTQQNRNTETQFTPTQPRFIRQPAVLARVGVTWITILRWEKQGRFPKRRKIGERAVAWVESEIDEWFAAKAGQVSGQEK